MSDHEDLTKFDSENKRDEEIDVLSAIAKSYVNGNDAMKDRILQKVGSSVAAQMAFLEQIWEVTEEEEAKNAIQEALIDIRLTILNKRFKNHKLENPKPDPEQAKTSKSETDHSAIPVSITRD